MAAKRASASATACSRRQMSSRRSDSQAFSRALGVSSKTGSSGASSTRGDWRCGENTDEVESGESGRRCAWRDGSAVALSGRGEKSLKLLLLAPDRLIAAHVFCRAGSPRIRNVARGEVAPDAQRSPSGLADHAPGPSGPGPCSSGRERGVAKRLGAMSIGRMSSVET